MRAEAVTPRALTLNKFSILAINKVVLEEHPKKWSDDDIRARSSRICSLICAVWPHT